MLFRSAIVLCFLLQVDCQDAQTQGDQSSDPSTLPKDSPALAITEISPLGSARNVSVDTSITVKFNTAMYASSLKVKLNKGSQNVALTDMNYNADTFVLSVKPLADLENNTVYRVTVLKTSKSVAGHRLVNDFSWSFSTGNDFNSLSEARITPGNLSEEFLPNKTAYRAQISMLHSAITFNAVAYDSNAQMFLTFGRTQKSVGQISKTLFLDQGTNLVNLLVNSANGSTKNYEFKIRRSWEQEAYVKSNAPKNGESFGGVGVNPLALMNDTLAVGVPRFDASNTLTDTGAVFIYRRVDSVWTQQQIIQAAIKDINDNFGFSVALGNEGNTLIVGATFEDSAFGAGALDNSQISSGAAYVFTRTSTTFSQKAMLKAFNAQGFLSGDYTNTTSGINDGDRYGYAVSIDEDGDTIAIYAPGEDSNFTGISTSTSDTNELRANNGAVYIYNWNGVEAVLEAVARTFKASAISNAPRGSIKISHNTLIWGDGRDSVSGATLNAEDCTQMTNALANYTVSSNSIGAVRVYEKVNGNWQCQAYIKEDISTQGAHNFGAVTDISGNTIVASSVNYPVIVFPQGPVSGSPDNRVIVSTRDLNGNWSVPVFLTLYGSSNFVGSHVQISGDLLVVGEPNDRMEGIEPQFIMPTSRMNNSSRGQSGAALIFKRDVNTNSWSAQGYIKSSTNIHLNQECAHRVAIDSFANSIAMSCNGDDNQIGGVQNTTAKPNEIRNLTGATNRSSNLPILDDAGAVFIYSDHDTPPVAADVEMSVEFNASKEIPFSATDADGDAIVRYGIVNQPTCGSIVCAAPTSCVFYSSALVGGSGLACSSETLIFTYKASDGVAESKAATVVVTVE